MRLELTRVGLLVKLVNHYTTSEVPSRSLSNNLRKGMNLLPIPRYGLDNSNAVFSTWMFLALNNLRKFDMSLNKTKKQYICVCVCMCNYISQKLTVTNRLEFYVYSILT